MQPEPQVQPGPTLALAGASPEVDPRVLATIPGMGMVGIFAGLVAGGAAAVAVVVAEWLGGALAGWSGIGLGFALLAVGLACGGYVGWVRSGRRASHAFLIESGFLARFVHEAGKRGIARPDDLRGLLDRQIQRLPAFTRRIATWLARRLIDRLAGMLGDGVPLARVTALVTEAITQLHQREERIAIGVALAVFAYPVVAMMF